MVAAFSPQHSPVSHRLRSRDDDNEGELRLLPLQESLRGQPRDIVYTPRRDRERAPTPPSGRLSKQSVLYTVAAVTQRTEMPHNITHRLNRDLANAFVTYSISADRSTATRGPTKEPYDVVSKFGGIFVRYDHEDRTASLLNEFFTFLDNKETPEGIAPELKHLRTSNSRQQRVQITSEQDLSHRMMNDLSPLIQECLDDANLGFTTPTTGALLSTSPGVDWVVTEQPLKVQGEASDCQSDTPLEEFVSRSETKKVLQQLMALELKAQIAGLSYQTAEAHSGFERSIAQKRARPCVCRRQSVFGSRVIEALNAVANIKVKIAERFQHA